MASTPILRGAWLPGDRAALPRLQRRLPPGLGLLLDDAGEVYRQELRDRTPIGRGGNPRKRRAGRTRAGWKVRKVSTAGLTSREIYNTEATLDIIVRGRKAIDQTTKTGAARHPLHFWIDGIELYRWRVKAVPANNFVPAALRAGRARVARAFPAQVAQILFSE